MKRTSFVVACTLAIMGCATPYQAKGVRGGYEDYRAGAGGGVMVSFDGNGYTSESDVLRMWHQRAAEVCGGPEQYEVLDGERSSDTAEIGSTTSTTNVTYSGDRAHATTVTSGPTRITRHRVQGLIRCVNGGSYDSSRRLAGG